MTVTDLIMADKSKSLLDNYEEYYDAASFISQQLDRDEVIRFAGLAGSCGANLEILDIGCAEGELAVLLAKQGNRVTASDISKNFLGQTAKRAGDSGVQVSTVFFDVEEAATAFNGKTFDVIYLMDVIEHLRSPVRALASIRELLKDNGALIIHTPNLCSLSLLYRYIRFRSRRENFFSPENLGDLHLQGYDYQTLEKVLNFVGLRINTVLPTLITLPVIYRFGWSKPVFRWLSRQFPLISDTLLVQCGKVSPVDMEKQMDYWKKVYGADSAENRG
jgi:ubiquinone/menaquinone biosynthesis C-methylase UbiE